MIVACTPSVPNVARIDGKGFGGGDPIVEAATTFYGQALSAATYLSEDGDPDEWLCSDTRHCDNPDWGTGCQNLAYAAGTKRIYLNSAFLKSEHYLRQKNALAEWNFSVGSTDEGTWPYPAEQVMALDFNGRKLVFNRERLAGMTSNELQNTVFQGAWRIAQIPPVSGSSPFNAGVEVVSLAASCQADYWRRTHTVGGFNTGPARPVFSDDFNQGTLGSPWLALPPACGFKLIGTSLAPDIDDQICRMKLGIGKLHDTLISFRVNRLRYPSSLRVAFRALASGAHYAFEMSKESLAVPEKMRWIYFSGTDERELGSATLPFVQEVHLSNRNRRLDVFFGTYAVQPFSSVQDNSIDRAGNIQFELKNTAIETLRVER